MDDFWLPFWVLFSSLRRHFSFLFRVHCLTLFFEGSWPAKWRPWPQLGLVLGHPKTQKVSSRLGETQVFDLAAFSTATSSWLLLGSSWGSSCSVFEPQNGSQIGPEVHQEAYQKWNPKLIKKIQKMVARNEGENFNFLAKTGHRRNRHFWSPALWRCLACLFGYLRP